MINYVESMAEHPCKYRQMFLLIIETTYYADDRLPGKAYSRQMFNRTVGMVGAI